MKWWMVDMPIEWFWTKLMVASKSINNIPDKYLSYARNARIYDWGIWVRKWKQILTTSTLWTNNKGGFTMNWQLYQIANSKIYQVDLTTGVQTEKATLWYDAMTDVLVYGTNIAIIASNWQALKVFDWTSVTSPATVPATNTGILEYCRGYSFLTSWNTLYISRPIVIEYPQNAYDFTWNWNQTIWWVTALTKRQTIAYDSNITGLKATLNWIYVFTEDKVDFLWANSLQNVSWSATFITSPIWQSNAPISNLCITASWDKIFYITKNLQVQTINYIPWVTTSQIWELSARPIVSIKEFMNTIDKSQPNAYAFYNENDKTIQFHIRSTWTPFNNYVLIYDLVNDTWNIDTNKNYNYVVKYGNDYYGFSDVNSYIYQDDYWNSDNGTPIEFRIVTNNLLSWTVLQKQYGWMFLLGWIGNLTELNVNLNVDNENVFNETINWTEYVFPPLWETWW
jgi:hypothetical protein